MMVPNKILWLLGYNGLSLVLEQERKHWLLKTDKKKQVQDNKTGDIFQGVIDNTGSDIVLESEKLPIKNDIVQKVSYVNANIEKILNVDYSAFTYSSMVNGLMFNRIISTSYPMNVGGEIQYKNYKLKFENCETCIIPFGGDANSSDVFADKWIRTTTPPKLLMLDNNGNYTIEVSVEFGDTITGVTYYYPLSEMLQPLGLTYENKMYITDMVNNDAYIGYPLYWFTCDQTDIGPTLSFTNNTNERNEQIMFIGNESNSSKYNAKIYVGIDGEYNATPHGLNTSEYDIICECKSGYSFKNLESDFDIPLEPLSISMNDTPIGIECSDKDIITMSKGLPWKYVDESTYSIPMSTFDVNCLVNDNDQPLVSVFDVHFDETIPFTNTTTDIGYSGVRINSSNISSDIHERYPHDLNKWNGLPEWMNSIDVDKVPQHMAIYAIHNTSTYDPSIPDSRQVAALLIDPGLVKTDDSEELSNDERGRIYVISNDEAVYKNNADEVYPKPARTVARICDIPTSVVQLSGITGIAPTSVVDKKYVRTEVSYNLEDKDRLYNGLYSRWVRPTSLDIDGLPITNEINQTNEYVFNNSILLTKVDLINHNDFRYHTNLNPQVDPTEVELASIIDSGIGYAVDDIGVVIVGGFAFHYIVSSVDESGRVLDLKISPSSEDYMINLSNFDMMNDMNGLTEAYGTSPLTGNGTGLRFGFIIRNFDNIKPSKGEVYPDLVALVKEYDGLWLYSYKIDQNSNKFPKTGIWEKIHMISENEQSSTIKSNNGLSTSESYMNSIIPTLRDLPVNLMDNNTKPTTISVISTPSMINIIDKTKSPVKIHQTSEDMNNDDITFVDMCKFYCDGIGELRATVKSVEGVLKALESNNKLRYDSYVFWKWDNANVPSNLKFKYGIIYRSFNNLLSTDYTTTLPVNELNCDNYVNSNPNTNIVWDVDKVGQMMWIYNPTYQKHELYNIDPSTQDLYIERRDLTWSDIDIRDSKTGSNITLIDPSTNRLLYNILTNNPVQASKLDSSMLNPDPLYQQPNFVQLPELTIGRPVSMISKKYLPMGNWQLVYPRVQSFKFVNEQNGLEYTPIKLHAIRTSNLNQIDDIIDELGNNVNMKNLIINESANNTISLNLYNSETGTWDDITK